MDYQLLKINKVTKLCDDRILMDEKGNILDIQWFDFQLNKLCDLLAISNFDNVHCPKIFHDGNPRPADNNYTNLFTRNQIFRALKNKYGSKSQGENDLVTIPDSDISGHIEDLENINRAFSFNLLFFLVCRFYFRRNEENNISDLLTNIYKVNLVLILYSIVTGLILTRSITFFLSTLLHQEHLLHVLFSVFHN